MADLKTKYLGLDVASPVIIGSSGITASIDNIIKLEKLGAGSVVLKSLFEEQIMMDIDNLYSNNHPVINYPEADDYINYYSKQNSLDEYLVLIRKAKNAVKIPVIASISCTSAKEWVSFAKEMQKAGADALELNVFFLPYNIDKSAEDYEKLYLDIITEVKKQVTIPIALKISYYFSSPGNFAKKMSWTGIKGLVLFNRFLYPDINIDNFEVITSSNIYTRPEDMAHTLRWIALLANKDAINVDLIASTGVHSSSDIIKLLLAGADGVQICSVLYKNGIDQVASFINELNLWMDKHQFANIEQFRGKMSRNKIQDPTLYQRSQYMRYNLLSK
ncbi:MAG: dihydroorotate dehydrogenase-like protein [Bacteroidales bacterium]|nr:dihydroorotate dehydrogenase-like protein [Bacteroidales bacterium]